MALSLPFRGKSPVLEDTASFLNTSLAKGAPPAQ